MSKAYDNFKRRLEKAETLAEVDRILVQASYEATPAHNLTNREMSKLVTIGHRRKKDLV